MTGSLMPTYNRLPVSFVKGEGAWLWDTEGNKYLDAVTGVAVCGLGHAHPAVQQTICEQAGMLLHTSNLYQINLQEQLGDRLTQLSGMDQAFFCNSGAEANEAAIKIARIYGHQQNIEKPAIIVTENSFHGRTLATLSATGNRKVQAGFEPLVQGFIRVPYNDIEAMAELARNRKDIAAVLVEPVQGEAGVIIPDDDYLDRLRSLCDENNWLLMLDEIQTGVGRTGKMFAHQHTGVSPDVMTLAKGLGNGIPIGACLVRGKAALFGPGNHGSTFGGNLLACRVGGVVIDTLLENNLIDRVQALGTRMLDGLDSKLSDMDGVKEIRGKGLMLAIELNKPCGDLVAMALQRGLLINVTGVNSIRLLPPFILSDQEADQIVDGVTGLIKDFLDNQT